MLGSPLLFAIVGRPAEAVAGEPSAIKPPGAVVPAVGTDAAGRGPVSLH